MTLSPAQTRMIARALEMDPALVPFAHQLLGDLDALGSDSDLVVEILRALGLPGPCRVLDLGCGKGDACFAIAEQLGWSCVGIDLYSPFVEAAQAVSKREGLKAHFEVGDVTQPLVFDTGFDVVLFQAMGDIVGSHADDVALLRRYCLPGGYMLISDGYLANRGGEKHQGFERYADRASTIRQLEKHGDRVIAEHPMMTAPPTDDELFAETVKIEARASEVASRHPSLSLKLAEYVQGQYDAVEWMDAHFVDAVWLIQRAED